jgi:hypothetical protein
LSRLSVANCRIFNAIVIQNATELWIDIIAILICN